jgi:crotonobetainyl-CoA:carnitine CoA-transferase CaiB-like acyl-CoA transferase
MGGMFGAIGVLASLQQRARTGEGQQVASALFENNVFLVAQHMLQYAVTGKPANPMPNRISAWAVYDVFTVKDGEQIFLAAVSDTQWAILCEEFGFDETEIWCFKSSLIKFCKPRLSWYLELGMLDDQAESDVKLILYIFEKYKD